METTLIDLMGEIGTRYFQLRGDSFLQDMTKNFSYPNLQINQDPTLEIPSGIHYMLAIVGFLFNNGFATSNRIRHICKEPKVLQILVDYSVKRFEEKFRLITYPLTYLNEHWYWPLSMEHNFMKGTQFFFL
jgi:hypothetical protein